MAVQSKTGTKSYAKGDVLYRQGDPAGKIFLLQTGLVSVTITKPTGPVEIFQATAPQIVGAEAIEGAPIYENSAIALNATTVIEVTAETTHQALEKIAPGLKQLVMSILAKYQASLSEIRRLKLSDDPTPCPSELTAKLFATIYHVVMYTAPKAKDGWHRIVWPTFRKYCQRVFLESPVRLEQAVYLLVHLGYAKLEMVKNEIDPDEPDELGFVQFKDLDQLKSFSEFARGRVKTGNGTLPIDLNDRSLKAGEMLLRTFRGTGPETAVIRLPLEDALSALQTELREATFGMTDLDVLIWQGLAAEIDQTGDQKVLTFVPSAIKKMFKNWRISIKLHEWNQNGVAPGAPEPAPDRRGKEAA